MLTFYEYMIKKYLGKSNRFGDLAGDMKYDKDFPRGSSDRKAIAEYLSMSGACEACMDTFKSAWRSYQRELRKQFKGEASIC